MKTTELRQLFLDLHVAVQIQMQQGLDLAQHNIEEGTLVVGQCL